MTSEHRSIAGQDYAVCMCGRYRSGRNWITAEELAAKILEKGCPIKSATHKQYAALVKREFGITLTSTERSHLHQLKEKVKRVEEQRREFEKIGLFSYI